MMNRKIIVPLIAILALIWYASRSTSDHELTSQVTTKPALRVEITLPQWQDWTETLQLQGAIKPWQEAIVSAEISALAVTRIDVDVGSPVRKGQLLAELNDVSLRAELSISEAQLETAIARHKQAEADTNRSRHLIEKQTISEQQFQQLEIAEEIAAAAVKSARAQIELSKIRLNQSRILAADDGVISARTVSLGEVISTGQELFRLVRQNRIEWHAELDPSQATHISAGMEARVNINDAKSLVGKVRQISPTLSNETRMAVAYIDLPNSSGVTAGIYTNGEIVIGNKRALSLPASAINWRDGRSMVFVVNDHVTTETPVVCGRISNDRIEIISGLTETSQVVKSGGAFLHDGDLVSLITTDN
jgi:RND family efflux transporter MFP subunit